MKRLGAKIDQRVQSKARTCDQSSASRQMADTFV